MLIKNSTTNVFKSIDQFMIGYMAVKGKSVSNIACEQDVSRQNVYEQKKKLEEQIERIGSEITDDNVMTIKIGRVSTTNSFCCQTYSVIGLIKGIWERVPSGVWGSAPRSCSINKF